MKDYLIGPAGNLEAVLTLMAEETMMEGGNVKLLLCGQPGVGKTELCNRLASTLTKGQPFCTESLNGKELDITRVKAMRQNMPYGTVFGDWLVYVINEIDRASTDAQALMLTLLDELPARRAILCTSNLQVGQLSDRFQTRFMQYKVAAPMLEEIAGLLVQEYPGLHETHYYALALGAGGNVRAGLADAKAAHLAMRADKMRGKVAQAPKELEELWTE
jgi:MoxR-like ATPase